VDPVDFDDSPRVLRLFEGFLLDPLDPTGSEKSTDPVLRAAFHIALSDLLDPLDPLAHLSLKKEKEKKEY